MTPAAGRARPANATRILANALSGAGSRVATMCVGFSLTPFIIGKLGIEQYGLWSVVGSLAGYLGLLDFGIGGAFVKFISEYAERDDRPSARQVISFGMLFYAGIGLVFALPVGLLAPDIVHAFKMPAASYAGAATLLRVMFALLVLTMIVNVPGMVLVAMQRMDIASRNNVLGYFAYAAATVVLLKLGYGIYGIVASSAVQVLVTALLHFRSARNCFGDLWHDPRRFDASIVRRLFGFGGWTQLTSIFQIVNLDVGRFIAAGIVSVASVGYYEIASKLAFLTRLFPSYLLNALLPAAAAADARGDQSRLRRIYAAGTRYQTFLTFASAGFLIAGADAIVRVWLGRPYPFVSQIIFWLCLGYAVNGLTGVGTTVMRAAGRPKYETGLTFVGAAVNLSATVVLARAYGIVGVAMATALGWLAGSVYFAIAFHRIRRTPFWAEIGWPLARMACACAFAAGLFYGLLHEPHVARTFEHRFIGLGVLGVASAAYALAFAALTWLFGVWRDDRPQLSARWREITIGASARFSGRTLRREA